MFLTEAANRGSISTGYDIDNSLKLEADNTEFMDRIITTTGNRRTWTHSSWVKRTEISYTGDGYGHTFFFGGAYGSEGCILRFNTGTTAATLDTIQIDIGAGGTLSRSHTSQVFRDAAAWYHIVLAVDTTQSTATDRFKLYVNGELVTSYYSRNNPAQNFDTGNNYASSSTYLNNVGAYKSGGTTYGKFCGYIAESYNIDGSALAPTEFGEFDEDSGIWKPKEYTGSFPNNSWYLDFEDSSDLGAQAKGDDRNFTLNNIAAADQSTDTPTNNFCTMNPLKGPLISFVNGTASNPRIPLMTEGATVLGNNANTYSYAEATMGVTSGKWYWEMKCTVDANTNVSGAGIATNINKGFYSTDGTGNFFWHMDGNRYVNGASTGYGAAWATNDILGFAYDADNWTLTCYKNNSSQGNVLASQADLSAEIVIPYMYSYGTHTYQWNFGGYHVNSLSSAASDANGYGSFEYAPPTGYYAICTKNLAEYG
jgi:hypothetical protein